MQAKQDKSNKISQAKPLIQVPELKQESSKETADEQPHEEPIKPPEQPQVVQEPPAKPEPAATESRGFLLRAL